MSLIYPVRCPANPSARQSPPLLKAIASLDAGDRFNIIHFNDHFGRFSPIPVPATKNYKNSAGAFVRHLTASGGTTVQPALRSAMVEVGDPDAVRMIMFLTDGDVGNENAIIGDIRNFRRGFTSLSGRDRFCAEFLPPEEGGQIRKRNIYAHQFHRSG